jgi:hypothetical protein
MSLDIAILDEAGRPKAGVPLTVDEHWTITQQAEQLALPLWSRMSDYYADADYDEDEVSALADEIVRLRSVCRGTDILAKLNEIEEMLRVAVNGHHKVSAIAD